MRIIEEGPLKGRVRISDFAEAAGVCKTAVRLWEAKGLINIAPPEREGTIDGDEARAWFATGGFKARDLRKTRYSRLREAQAQRDQAQA